ncbi:MAG TPA: hypothetical protein H9740_02335 [Candidatus Hungatella pullicola]|nr:hypothetical protein [Candidatus Hungatella pullicola]
MKTDIIDVHSHILPGIDDGAGDMEETRAMLRMAYDNGIRKIIATPHYQAGQPKTYVERIKEAVRKVQLAASEIDPEFAIYGGNEILYFDGAADKLKEGEILTLADSSYVLVEFPVGVSYNSLYQAIRKLAMAKYRPIIAHAERFSCLREPGNLEEAKEAGAFIQINYSSLQRGWFQGDCRWCRKQILEGRVHLLGTDMHNMTSRPPQIGQALSWLEKKLQPSRLNQLLSDNPEAVLSNIKLE